MITYACSCGAVLKVARMRVATMFICRDHGIRLTILDSRPKPRR